MDLTTMVFSEGLENGSKEIKIEEMQEIKLEDLHHSIDVKEEISITEVLTTEELEDMDIKIEDLQHSINISEFQLDRDSSEAQKCKQFDCGVCNVIFTNILQVREHNVKIHGDVKPFLCSICGRTFSIEKSLQRHLKPHIGVNPFVYEVCGNKSYDGHLLNSYFRTREEKKPIKWFECKICDLKFSNPPSLKCHLRVTHDVKPLACKVCKYKCYRKANMKSHLRTHKEPIECEICDFKCSHYQSLKQHIQVTHNGMKPFACKVCKYKSFHNANMKSHMRIHTGEKLIECKVCDFKCSRFQRLKQHLEVIHNGMKPFVCEFCRYTSNDSENFTLHIETHSGPNSFKCKICTFTCSNLTILKNHNIETHNQEKRFACEICDFKCFLKGQLRFHLVNHIGEQPFKCKMCDFKCSSSAILKFHISTHHSKSPSM